jgi:hypothetical protein
VIHFNGLKNSTFSSCDLIVPNVGIGTTAPTVALDVAGQLKATHMIGRSAIPGLAAGGGLGGTAATTLFRGTATGAASSAIVTITFSTAYSSTPNCVISPANAAAASIPVASQVWVSTSTTALIIESNSTGLPAGTYQWNYVCIQ